MLSVERIAARLRDERGIAMVLAIGISAVLAVTTVATIELTSSSSRTSSVSRAYSTAQSLAEAGVNDAQARLNDPGNSPLDDTLLTGTVACPDGVVRCFQTAYEGGTTSWFGAFDPVASEWTITSWGLTPNPTNAGQTIQRVIRARTTVVAESMQPLTVPAWSYVYVKGTSNSTSCDVLLDNHSWVKVNFYVEGNLCLRNHATVHEFDHSKPMELIVRGKIELDHHIHDKVGMSTSDRISTAKVGGGCTSNIAQSGHVCTPPADKFYVDDYQQSAAPIAAPVADHAGWYNAAKPGPRYPCTTSSGTVPTWDNDANLNLATTGSAGTFNLTPGSSYTCRYERNGVTVGELSWNASTETLIVKGVVYYDGSMTVTNDDADYDGSGTIYLTGTLTFDGQLCALDGGSWCDFPDWNPNSELLVFAVNGGTATNSVYFDNGSQFQGGIYAKNTVVVRNHAYVEGPMIANDVEVNNHAHLKPLPAITSVAAGTPGNPITNVTLTPPSYS